MRSSEAITKLSILDSELAADLDEKEANRIGPWRSLKSGNQTDWIFDFYARSRVKKWTNEVQFDTSKQWYE
jgi:hypothetical protein